MALIAVRAAPLRDRSISILFIGSFLEICFCWLQDATAEEEGEFDEEEGEMGAEEGA